MLQRTRLLAGGAAAIGAGVLLVGPLNAAAQDDGDTSETTDTTTDAPARQPSDNGPSGADERPVGEEWLAGALDELVKSGTLTQEQADAVVVALEQARPDLGPGGADGPGGANSPGGPGRRHGPGGPGRLGGPVALDAAATAIGIDDDELRTALRDGQTLAEVAAANGVDAQTVIDALVTEASTRLDEAVAEGRLDTAEADERRTDTTERITELVNEGLPTSGED